MFDFSISYCLIDGFQCTPGSTHGIPIIFFADTVQLIDINITGFQIIQTIRNMFGSTFGAALQGFGGDYNLVSDGLQCNTELFFTVPVHVGRIEKRYATLETMPHNGHPVFNAQRDDGGAVASLLLADRT